MLAAFVALIPLAIYPSGATTGKGQLAIHILPLLLTSLILLRQPDPDWHKDLLGAFLFLIALVKPSVSVPFFWLVLFVPGRLRPTMFVVLGYVGLTWLTSLFQPAGPIQFLYDWQTLARAGIDWGAQTGGGVNNLPGWLGFQDVLSGNMAFSLILLMGLGVWTYFHRRADLWILRGVTAVVARFWTYHRWYDEPAHSATHDCSAAHCQPKAGNFRSETRGSYFVCAHLAPYDGPGRVVFIALAWNEIYVNLQAVIWIADLIFFVVLARSVNAWRQTSTKFYR